MEYKEECRMFKKRKYNSEKIELKDELKSAFFVNNGNELEFASDESDMESDIEIESNIEFKSKEFISDESEVESEVEIEVESELDEDIYMNIDPDIDMRSDGSDYYYDDLYDLGYEDECFECFEI